MNEPSKTGITPIDPPERKRVYVFPGDLRLTLTNVTGIEVRASGKHRIECDGKPWGFVNTGWLWIELDIEKWTL